MTMKINVVYFALFLFNQCGAITVGSDTTPSRETLVSFSGSPNTILGFAAMDNGFYYSSATTTCTFDDFFPVSGPINLNNGTLYLAQDLTLMSDVLFHNSGSIIGFDNTIKMSPKITTTTFPSTPRTNPLKITDATLLSNANITLNAPLHIYSYGKIQGKGNRLTISRQNPIVIRNQSALYLEDIELYGVGNDSLRCIDNTGIIYLKNSKLVLNNAYTFSQGSMSFDGDVVIRGTNIFSFASSMSSTINAYATLLFDIGTTISFSPARPYRTILYMSDNSSKLYLNGCSLVVSRTGLELANGTIIFDNKVTMSSQARAISESIIFKNTTQTKVLSAAKLDIYGNIFVE